MLVETKPKYNSEAYRLLAQAYERASDIEMALDTVSTRPLRMAADTRSQSVPEVRGRLRGEGGSAL